MITAAVCIINENSRIAGLPGGVIPSPVRGYSKNSSCTMTVLAARVAGGITA